MYVELALLLLSLWLGYALNGYKASLKLRPPLWRSSVLAFCNDFMDLKTSTKFSCLKYSAYYVVCKNTYFNFIIATERRPVLHSWYGADPRPLFFICYVFDLIYLQRRNVAKRIDLTLNFLLLLPSFQPPLFNLDNIKRI